MTGQHWFEPAKVQFNETAQGCSSQNEQDLADVAAICETTPLKIPMPDNAGRLPLDRRSSEPAEVPAAGGGLWFPGCHRDSPAKIRVDGDADELKNAPPAAAPAAFDEEGGANVLPPQQQQQRQQQQHQQQHQQQQHLQHHQQQQQHHEFASTSTASAESTGTDQRDFPGCRWHNSANSVGVVSADGHVFTKTDAGSKKIIMSNRGLPVELSSICMVFDASLRCGGIHHYNYQILDGELGAADGVGFVFDKQVRRNNIQRMRSVFLNQRGRICLRNNGHVCKLGAQLPPLAVGMYLTLHIDLDNLLLQFAMFNGGGLLSGYADVSLTGLMTPTSKGEVPRSGFFCAVVTKDISVALS